MQAKETIDFFRLFFDQSVLGLIVCQTNLYADQFLEKKRENLHTHPHARAHDWQELEVFLGLVIAMGNCGFPTLRQVCHVQRKLYDN